MLFWLILIKSIQVKSRKFEVQSPENHNISGKILMSTSIEVEVGKYWAQQVEHVQVPNGTRPGVQRNEYWQEIT